MHPLKAMCLYALTSLIFNTVGFSFHHARRTHSKQNNAARNLYNLALVLYIYSGSTVFPITSLGCAELGNLIRKPEIPAQCSPSSISGTIAACICARQLSSHNRMQTMLKLHEFYMHTSMRTHFNQQSLMEGRIFWLQVLYLCVNCCKARTLEHINLCTVRLFYMGPVISLACVLIIPQIPSQLNNMFTQLISNELCIVTDGRAAHFVV